MSRITESATRAVVREVVAPNTSILWDARDNSGTITFLSKDFVTDKLTGDFIVYEPTTTPALASVQLPIDATWLAHSVETPWGPITGIQAMIFFKTIYDEECNRILSEQEPPAP